MCVPPNFGQNKRGPSTPEEKANAVKSARLLERDPLNKDAKEIREWFTRWLIEVPDISVEVCSGYLKPLYAAKDKNYSTEIASQMMFLAPHSSWRTRNNQRIEQP
jgi:hypothetical protein